MKKLSIGLFVILIQTLGWGQHAVEKDLDQDGILDRVYIDSTTAVIVCRLSTQKNKVIKSKPIEILNESSSLKATKSGFTFNNNWMRAGYSNQFRYDQKTKRIQLIGMSRYEFGNAANDGSGESSVNLLTGDYLGNWNYYDMEKEALITLPTIKKKMVFKPVYLKAFGEEVYFGYAERCAQWFVIYKDKSIKAGKRSSNSVDH